MVTQPRISMSFGQCTTQHTMALMKRNIFLKLCPPNSTFYWLEWTDVCVASISFPKPISCLSPPPPPKKALDPLHFHLPIAVLLGDKGPSSPVRKDINAGKQLTAIYLLRVFVIKYRDKSVLEQFSKSDSLASKWRARISESSGDQQLSGAMTHGAQTMLE